MDDVVILPHALKHGISADEIYYAWNCVQFSRQRNGDNDPPIWIALGVLPNGNFAEMVALLDIQGRRNIFHAMTPPTKKFLKELNLI